VSRTVSAVAVAATLLAGCGGSARHGTGPRAPAGACSQRVGPAVARAAGAQAAPGRQVAREPQLVTCVFAAGRARVRVVTDGLPQAYRRWVRAQVERWQNTAGWATHPKLVPQLVSGLGAGAFWVPGDRSVVATDGRSLVTATVVGAPRAGARRIAIAAVRASLGPTHLPPPSGGA
jgi:hypothetical protein